MKRRDNTIDTIEECKDLVKDADDDDDNDDYEDDDEDDDDDDADDDDYNDEDDTWIEQGLGALEGGGRGLHTQREGTPAIPQAELYWIRIN